MCRSIYSPESTRTAYGSLANTYIWTFCCSSGSCIEHFYNDHSLVTCETWIIFVLNSLVFSQSRTWTIWRTTYLTYYRSSSMLCVHMVGHVICLTKCFVTLIAHVSEFLVISLNVPVQIIFKTAVVTPRLATSFLDLTGVLQWVFNFVVVFSSRTEIPPLSVDTTSSVLKFNSDLCVTPRPPLPQTTSWYL